MGNSDRPQHRGWATSEHGMREMIAIDAAVLYLDAVHKASHRHSVLDVVEAHEACIVEVSQRQKQYKFK